MKTKMSVVSLGLVAATLGFLYSGSNQLLAGENETKPLLVPREARDVGIGVTPLETRHCYPVGASA